MLRSRHGVNPIAPGRHRGEELQHQLRLLQQHIPHATCQRLDVTQGGDRLLVQRVRAEQEQLCLGEQGGKGIGDVVTELSEASFHVVGHSTIER